MGMPKLLVVDDSSIDRDFIGRLLGDPSGFELEYATHGTEALERMERDLPDLVLTDLIMPEMNGLELVAAIRQKYPQVPVILMTSKGSEEVAVQALQRGAASYVPKRMLSQKLVDTLHRVAAVSGHRRGQSRLMRFMTESHCVFVLENDPLLIPPLVAHLQDIIAQLGLCQEADRTRIGVALGEALANALFHGNLEIASESRGEDNAAYLALIERRRRELPYRDRRIWVEVTLSPQEAVFSVRDEGSGFDPAALPDPTDPANLERTCGRGILLMRTFMDEVIFNAQGNEVTLIKRCPESLEANRVTARKKVD